MAEAIRRVRGYAEQISGYYVEVYGDSLDQAQAAYDDLRRLDSERRRNVA
jgi:hypothetical protein